MKNVTNSSSTAILARLLATENLTVTVDAKAPTAAFDLKTRTLILPNWENMGTEVQHLLVGHEVGHALYTTEEGWHNALDTRGGAFKSFLNVVEDARIEKKIKRKYPGLRKDFQSAYKYLFEQDFFGVRDESIEDQILIDRVNLHFKLGTNIKVKFSKVEQPLVDAVADAETWEQVVAAAQALFDYCKKEQEEKKNQSPASSDGDSELDEQDDMFGDYEDDSEEEEEPEEDDSGEDSEESDTEGEEESSGSSETDDGEEEEESENDGQGNADGTDEDGEPESKTDKAFRLREGTLASTTPINVMALPSCDYRKFLISKEKFSEYLKFGNDKFYTAGTKEKEALDAIVSEFMSSSKGIIDLYVKEFQMRKSAASWKKARVSDTGDINPAKLAYYKLTDQVFKSRTLVPNGKNHGMVMLLDLSGSMADNFRGSVEQVIVLAAFCKRVGIPFQVIGFTENNHSRGYYTDDENKAIWTKNLWEVNLECCTLIELMSSDMKPNQFQASIRDMLFYAEMFTNSSWRNPSPLYNFAKYPHVAIQLGSTPLSEALVLMRQVLPEFQKKFRVEVLDFVVVTDGEGDRLSTCMKPNEHYGIRQGYMNRDAEGNDARMKLRIGKNMYDMASTNDFNSIILKSIKADFGANILGFFLVNRGRWNYSTYRRVGTIAINKDGQRESMDLVRDKIKGDGFYESYAHGFDRYFIVTATEAEEIEIQAGASKAKIKSAFSKNGRNKKLNKVLASKFMDIAA